jgi:hypothetical protein
VELTVFDDGVAAALQAVCGTSPFALGPRDVGYHGAPFDVRALRELVPGDAVLCVKGLAVVVVHLLAGLTDDSAPCIAVAAFAARGGMGADAAGDSASGHGSFLITAHGLLRRTLDVWRHKKRLWPRALWLR